MAAGFFGIAYFQQHPELAGAVTANPETVFMELTKILFNPWIAGIVLAAILAAVIEYSELSVTRLLKYLDRRLLQILLALKMPHKKNWSGSAVSWC